MKLQNLSAQESRQKSVNAFDAAIAVIGTVAIDKVETPFGKRESVFGGSAAYFSYAAGFFTKVALVAVVGEDFPQEYRGILTEKPIDLSHLVTLPGKTFSWSGKYEYDMNTAHTLETNLNVLLEFNPQLKFEKQPPFIFLANIAPELQLRVIDQLDRKAVRYIACDTMNFWIENKKEDLKRVFARVNCVILNDGEARQITGETNLIRAAQKVRDMGPEHVVVKKGEHGVLLLFGDRLFALPAYPLESVFDPTGAGDTFGGGLMGYLASRDEISFESFKQAIAMGQMVASHTVENFGLEALRKIGKSHLDDRLAEFRKICSF